MQTSISRLTVVIAGLFTGHRSLSRGAGEENYCFEVGLLGPRREPIPLKQSGDSAEIRKIVTWLSETIGIPTERRDRRTP
jgi:hypothetical protein